MTHLINPETDENLLKIYNEIKLQLVKDILKLMKDTSSEYITASGFAFLDGLQVNGECIDIVSKDKYDVLLSAYKDIEQEKKELKKRLKKCERLMGRYKKELDSINSEPKQEKEQVKKNKFKLF